MTSLSYTHFVPPQSPSAAHCFISLHSCTNPRPEYPEPPGLHFCQLQGPGSPPLKWCLQFLDSTSVSVTDELCFLSLSPSVFVWQVCVSVGFVFSLPLFLIIPFWQGPRSDNCTDTSILTLHMPLSISVTGQVCFLLLPPLLFVGQFCASLFCLASFLTRSLIR